MGQKENEVEQYLCKMVRELGGIPYKFTSPGRNSVPDRICVFPGGGVLFVECKAPDGKLSLGQIHEINLLQKLNQVVVVVSTKIEVDAIRYTLTGGDKNDQRIRGTHTSNQGVFNKLKETGTEELG